MHDALAPEDSLHSVKIKLISLQLRKRSPGKPVSLRKKAVSHQVPKRVDLRRADEKIDVADLDRVLQIDPVRRTCVAEPGVTFEDLVDQTMKHGLVPIVVPELRTITIGGAVSGCSLESMSFRYGGFHDTCIEYEVITARGEVLRCTPDNENALLFQMMHGSFGTLGILSKLTFRLVPCKPFVHVVYEHFTTAEDYQLAIRKHCASDDIDFVDGFIHSPNRYALCLGRFVETAPYVHRYDWMRIYYKSTWSRTEDYLRTKDYFFRYDRGVTNVTPSSFLGRLLIGKFLTSARLLRLAHTFPRLLSDERPNVTLDLFVPISRANDFLEWYAEKIGHFPLWCVPYKRVRDYDWIAPAFYENMQDTMFVDLAIYGMQQPQGRNIYKEIEDALPRFGALKSLISYNYYDEETFWRVFNKENYQAAKKIADPDNLFRDLFEKTRAKKT